MTQLTSEQVERAFRIVAPAINQLLRPKGTDMTIWPDYDPSLVILVFETDVDKATFDNILVWERSFGSPTEAKEKLREQAITYAKYYFFREGSLDGIDRNLIGRADEGISEYVVVAGVATFWAETIASWILMTCLAVLPDEDEESQ